VVAMPREVVATGEFWVVSATASDPRRGEVFGIPSTGMFVEWTLVLEHTGDRGRHQGTLVAGEWATFAAGMTVYGDVDNYGRFRRGRRGRR
jgi:hypothetical protein